jgi:hypothetical protein
LRNPEKMAKLVEEVRSAFMTDEEITLFSASDLPYARAVLDGSMRIYLLVAIFGHRMSPQGGARMLGKHVPEGVSHSFEVFVIGRSHLERAAGNSLNRPLSPSGGVPYALELPPS